MTITLKINGVDRTSSVVKNSLQKSDVINEKADTLQFAVDKYGDKTFEPRAGDSVELFGDGQAIYKGLILTVKKSSEGHTLVRYEADCVDNTYFLTRVLVIQSYANTTINAIIADLIATYAPDFTASGVDADVAVESIAFNRISVSEALQKLANLSNYSWYVDYSNDIHFFVKNTERSPFNITDTSGNYIYDSLEVSEDISQLRNRVFIQGGEAEGNVRTEQFNGDGVKKFFKLSNKFTRLPTVTVGGASKTVGVDFLDNDTDFDVLWNYNETYLKFTTAPAAGTNNIQATGNPLYPILVQVEDAPSIAQYGLQEFSKTDKTIKSKKEAKDFAIAELQAYSQKISESSFSTYTPGLRSGQTITVNSTARNINEDFLIQRVSFSMVSQQTGIYNVELATLKAVTLVDFLINQLREKGSISEDKENAVLEKFTNVPETITVGELFAGFLSSGAQSRGIAQNAIIQETFTPRPLNYAVEFVLSPATVNGTKRPFILNQSPLS